MGAISLKPSVTAYGNNSWATHNPMVNGGTTYDYKNRLTFPSLSAGKPIANLTFTFYKESTNSGSNTWKFYATTDAEILGNNITAATYVGELVWTRSSAGLVVLTFTQVMMDVVAQYTGTWYLLIDADSPYQTTYTGGSGTDAPIFEGAYSDGSIYCNEGGIQKISVPAVNDSGVWKDGVMFVNDAGVWKQGIA